MKITKSRLEQIIKEEVQKSAIAKNSASSNTELELALKELKKISESLKDERLQEAYGLIENVLTERRGNNDENI